MGSRRCFSGASLGPSAGSTWNAEPHQGVVQVVIAVRGRSPLTLRTPSALVRSYENRCPHINCAILGIGLTRRLVTTVFFSDTPETLSDPVLDCVPDLPLRRRLIAQRDRSLDAEGLPAYRFDVILRGEGETPFFVD